MTEIRPYSDVGSKYNDVFKFSHKYSEPVFMTIIRKGHTEVMSIVTNESLLAKLELYNLLEEGIDAVKKNKGRPFHDVVSDLQKMNKPLRL